MAGRVPRQERERSDWLRRVDGLLIICQFFLFGATFEGISPAKKNHQHVLSKRRNPAFYPRPPHTDLLKTN
jgi:hypothetical protein